MLNKRQTRIFNEDLTFSTVEKIQEILQLTLIDMIIGLKYVYIQALISTVPVGPFVLDV